MSDIRVAYRRPLLIGAALLIAAVLLAVGIGLGAAGAPLGVDSAWQDLLAASRAPVGLALSYAMNWLGGGWFGAFALPVIVAGLLLLVRRPWGAAYFVVAELVSVGITQVLKSALGRPRPADMIVVSDFGSFPSGHVANAATVATALFVLFPLLWVGIAGAVWTVAMAFSRTYLGAHWLSDTLGGALIGAGAALLAAAAFAGPLADEARRVRQRRAGTRTPVGQ